MAKYVPSQKKTLAPKYEGSHEVILALTAAELGYEEQLKTTVIQ